VYKPFLIGWKDTPSEHWTFNFRLFYIITIQNSILSKNFVPEPLREVESDFKFVQVCFIHPVLLLCLRQSFDQGHTITRDTTMICARGVCFKSLRFWLLYRRSFFEVDEHEMYQSKVWTFRYTGFSFAANFLLFYFRFPSLFHSWLFEVMPWSLFLVFYSAVLKQMLSELKWFDLACLHASFIHRLLLFAQGFIYMSCFWKLFSIHCTS
jgi:hypothetical protein